MKKLGYSLLLSVIAGTPSPSYGEPWAITIASSITLNQSAYSNNWAGGESGNVAWTLMSNSTAQKPLSSRVTNANTLKLYFGQTRTQDPETNDWSGPEKSTDLIDLESIFRLTLGKFVDPFASARIETFFTDLRDSTETRFINPVTITESVGVARVFLKQEHREWTTRLGLGIREHIDRNVLDPITLDRSTETGVDGGLEFVNELKSPLAGDRITVTSKLIIFQALANSRSDDLRGQPGAEYWKAPDINFENIFTANITRYLIVNLYTQFLYDKEISRGGRFKQTLGLGLAYNIIR